MPNVSSNSWINLLFLIISFSNTLFIIGSNYASNLTRLHYPILELLCFPILKIFPRNKRRVKTTSFQQIQLSYYILSYEWIKIRAKQEDPNQNPNWILLASVTENLTIKNTINFNNWTIRANSATNYQL